MKSRFGKVPPEVLIPVEDVLNECVDLAVQSRGGWGLTKRDANLLSLALYAERCLDAEKELAELKKEVAGLRLTAARMKKKADKAEEAE